MRAMSLCASAAVGVVMGAAPTLPAAAAAVSCHGVAATIVGTTHADVIHGTSGRDVIAARGGGDTIYAGGGNDLVCGGKGADRIYGGTGRDTLYGGRDGLHNAAEDGVEKIGDTLHGGPGDDVLYAGADRRPADIVVLDVYSWDGAAHGVDIDMRSRTARGEGADRFGAGSATIVGSSHADVIDGTDRRDWIYSGAGADVIRGHGGGDRLYADSVGGAAGGGADKVWGGDGNDWLWAGPGDDRLSGGSGNDTIEDRGASDDVLIGGKGDDHLSDEVGGGAAPQIINGGAGHDSLQLSTDKVNPKLAASTGTWDMASGAMTFTLDKKIELTVRYVDVGIFVNWGTSWTVTGTTGDDMVTGAGIPGGAGTTFDGLAGDDTFRGSDYDDTFDGGPGQDHSLGMGDGDDTCVSVETIDGADCEHVS